MKFVSSIMQLWKAPDLRRKVLTTVFLLFIFRVIAHIPVPNVDSTALKSIFEQNQLLSLLDIFSGGGLSKFTIAAMGVNPYINASIIIQLLTMIVPKLEEIQKDGEHGRQKMNQYMRLLTIPLAAVQAIGFITLFNQSGVFGDLGVVEAIQIVFTLTVTTIVVMWLGELITENGIGNGISLLIFTGIVGRLPSTLGGLFNNTSEMTNLLIFIAVTILTVLVVVFINEGQRKIPVTYAKRVRGNKMYGGSSTHIPLKVNTAGVIPIIFASSIISFPGLIANFLTAAKAQWLRNLADFLTSVFATRSAVYYGIMFLLVIGFTYFYSLVTFNPTDVADNLKRQGGFIPGIRPGQATVAYLNKILSRITLAGALFLASVAVLPYLIESFTGIPAILQGTSLLIMVSVILETMRQIESQLIMRNYETFLDRK